MHILYVSQYFPPEMGAPAARVYEMARHWVAAGHQVTVLTGFAHHPTGIKAPADRWKVTRRETKDGIRVVRSYVYAAANRGTAKRMTSYASFMASAALIGALRVRRPDVVIATSPQLLCACAGYALAKRFGAPLVFEVRDLWPESILAVEAMKENMVVRGLKRVAHFLYHKSDTIVTVGEGYKRQIHQRYDVPNDKMHIVTNGIDSHTFEPGKGVEVIRREFGWQEKRVLLYVGTHGMAHALHRVLEAARAMRNRPDILFAFVGEGAEKNRLKQLADQWSLTNVQFIEQQPKRRVAALYAACDLGLVTLRKTELFQDVLPSKIFEYMAMAKPMLISVGGEARRVVEEAGAGVYVEPENVDRLVAAIRDHVDDDRSLERMGRAGRRYVLAHYDRSVKAGEYLELLEQLVGSGVRVVSQRWLSGRWRQRRIYPQILSALGTAKECSRKDR